jgi:hypothetical protein
MVFELLSRLRRAPERLRRRSGLGHRGDRRHPRQQLPGRDSCNSVRFAARLLGLASGLALAVRPAGLAEVSRVNGAPKARPAQQSREVKDRAGLSRGYRLAAC